MITTRLRTLPCWQAALYASPSPSMATLGEFDAYVKANTWREAKTYAKSAPHEYLVRDRLPVEAHAEFKVMTQFVLDNGKPEKFFRTTFNYFRHGGYKYRTMAEPSVNGAPRDYDIINRAKILLESSYARFLV